MKPTIITLGPSNNLPTVKQVSYEEAFGEFSEARGRGRSRRATRRTDRREKKKERKLGRISNRDEVKTARRGAKIGRRTERQSQREAKRTAAMESRQGRKFGRKEMKLQRRALGDEQEMEMDQQSQMETGNGYQDQGGSDQGYQDQGGSDQGGSDQGGSDQGGSDQGYQDQGGSDQGGGGGSYGGQGGGSGYGSVEDTGEEWGGANPWANEQSGWQDSPQEADAQGGEGEGEYETTQDGDYEDSAYAEEDMIGADGTEFGKGAEQAPRIHPKILQHARKIEDSKARLIVLQTNQGKLIAALAKPNRPMAQVTKLNRMLQNVQAAIAKHQIIIGEGESRFSDFSCADGQRNVQGRVKMIGAAKSRARKERIGAMKGQNRAKMLSKIRSKAMRNNGGSETPVEADLDPTFGNQRIVVPSDSNFSGNPATGTGTGIIALDAAYDFDAPETRKIELFSNAEGDAAAKKAKMKKTIMYAAIGVGVALLAIYAYKKLKK